MKKKRALSHDRMITVWLLPGNGKIARSAIEKYSNLSVIFREIMPYSYTPGSSIMFSSSKRAATGAPRKQGQTEREIMAHMIARTAGKDAIAYVGAKPWHGLGQELQPGASMEAWLEQSGLTYTIDRAPVTYTTSAGQVVSMGNREVLYRTDTGAALGVVSPAFNIVQPAEVLEFFRDLCDEFGFTLETAGAIRGGAVFWALAKNGYGMNMGTATKRDDIEGYTLLSSGADGNHATEGRDTSVRVVCNNTLTVALNRAARRAVKTSHVSQFDPAAVKRALGLIDHAGAWEKFREQMLALQTVRVSDEQAAEFLGQLLRPEKPAKDAAAFDAFMEQVTAPVRAVRGLEQLLESYHAAPGAAPGTAYGLVQGVTHYVDHARNRDADKRLTSAWFGTGEQMKARALETALALAA